ncbi:unnamed protein product [Adineta ricciae]|uniref:Uncharacterized protein n=1 Tax=Adineta ricciae TaxID=249248 RepID=A0A815MMR4_ADIRI|nr:unnamed protein product [Adineta ricciae]CAF1426863.1 unnamed protein product [Adineta ricciae]
MALNLKIFEWLKKLNIFDGMTNNTVEQQRRATRLYIVLLIIALFILILNNLLVHFFHTFTVSNPSLDQYRELEHRYGIDAISCPCTQLSIPYASFVETTFNFHELCGSQFVSNIFIQNLFQVYNGLNNSDPKLIVFTLEGTAFSRFQSLAILCNITADIIHDGRQQFLSSSVISAYMIDIDLFNQQTNAALEKFQSTLPQTYINSLELLRSLTQGNGLVSLFSTNWYLQTYNVSYAAPIYFHPQIYGNCSCATSSACTQPSVPFISGYLVGCTPLESLLQSTLECLYDQSCIDLLTFYLNMSLPSRITSLHKNTTRFSSNDTIDSIARQLFIETRSSNISYDNFFQKCQPLTCYVMIITPNNYLIVITTILGLYGGLTTFLKLVVPWSILTIEKLKRKLSQNKQVRAQPTTNMMDS